MGRIRRHEGMGSAGVWFAVQYCPFSIDHSRLGRSRPLYSGDEFSGLRGNWVDGSALQGIVGNHTDAIRHVAKVRVAGSNPVFRSNTNSGLSWENVGGASVRTLDSCPSPSVKFRFMLYTVAPVPA